MVDDVSEEVLFPRMLGFYFVLKKQQKWWRVNRRCRMRIFSSSETSSFSFAKFIDMYPLLIFFTGTSDAEAAAAATGSAATTSEEGSVKGATLGAAVCQELKEPLLPGEARQFTFALTWDIPLVGSFDIIFKIFSVFLYVSYLCFPHYAISVLVPPL